MKKKVMYFMTIITLFLLSFDKVVAYQNYKVNTVKCGSGMLTGIPSMIPQVVSIVYSLLQIVVPILLVIFGTIDLIKAITAGKEDDIKKAQSTFLRRLITGLLIFFIFTIVKILISVAADKGKVNKIINCTNCFLSNKCKKET